MNLHEYLQSEGALSVSALRALIAVGSDSQVRQWQHRYGGRVPSPENCTAIEAATQRKVMRWDLRPTDWHRIWPELIGTDGAPAVPTADAPEDPPSTRASPQSPPSSVPTGETRSDGPLTAGKPTGAAASGGMPNVGRGRAVADVDAGVAEEARDAA